MEKNNIYIWQGFDHCWNYNHRMNRLGSFIDESKGQICHSGASGTGKDKLEYRDMYTKIVTDKISSRTGKKRFILKGTESYVFKKEHKEEVDIDGHANKYIILLHGFDIYSNEDSDSLLILDIEIENTKFETDKLKFDIVVHLNVDCKTIECKPLNKDFSYTLDVHYQILSCKKDEVKFSFLPVHKNAYSWNKRTEIFMRIFGSIKRNNYLKYDARKYPYITGGYKRIGVNINYRDREKAPHMLRLCLAIDSIYIKSRHQYNVRENLFFKNWRTGMKWYNLASLFSFRRYGSFIGLSEMILVHLKNAKIKPSLESRGWLVWPGANKPSNDPGGVRSTKLL